MAEEPHCDLETPPLRSPTNHIHDHLMKIEWLITNVTAVETPVSAESDGFWVILDVFWLSCVAFAVEEPLCDLEITS